MSSVAPNPSAAPIAPVAPIGAAPAASPAPAAPWYGEIPDADLKGYAELKAWKTPIDAIKASRDAERLIGVPKDQLLRLPPDLNAAKPEDLNPIYDRLGRPAKPEDYKIENVAGDQTFTDAMRPVLHGIGLTQRQVDALVPAWNKYVTDQYGSMEREQEQKEQIDLQTLHREWPGETFTQREEMARRAVREFVMPVAGDPEKAGAMLGQIEDAIGTASFLKLFSEIGSKIGESKFVDSNTNRGTFGMTPAAAKAELDMKKQDHEWSKKVLSNPGGPEGQEWDRLIKLASQAPRG